MPVKRIVDNVDLGIDKPFVEWSIVFLEYGFPGLIPLKILRGNRLDYLRAKIAAAERK